MATLFSILAMIIGLGAFVCFVLILIKLYQEKGPVHAILGVVTCGIYPFIWGWMNVARLNVNNIMMAWTGCIVLGIIFNVLSAAMS